MDTHALIQTEVGFCPGLPFEVLEIISPKACAFIESSPHLILQRRTQDTSRARDHQAEKKLALHQELSRSYLNSCCMITGAILCHILNDSPEIQINSTPLIKLIRSYT